MNAAAIVFFGIPLVPVRTFFLELYFLNFYSLQKHQKHFRKKIKNHKYQIDIRVIIKCHYNFCNFATKQTCAMNIFRNVFIAATANYKILSDIC